MSELPPVALLHPRCGRCGTLVERVEACYSANGLVLTAECHGDREQLYFSPTQIRALAQLGVGPGIAFRPADAPARPPEPAALPAPPEAA